MSVHEVTAALQWIVTVLSEDDELSSLAPGGVWIGVAPENQATPFVVVSLQSGSDVITANGFRIFVDGLFLVKAVGPATSSSTVSQAASRLDDLIGSPPTSGSTTGGYILSSYRQSPHYLDEVVYDMLWTNIGGLYRIIVEQAP